jgi:hypothetical protein
MREHRCVKPSHDRAWKRLRRRAITSPPRRSWRRVCKRHRCISGFAAHRPNDCMQLYGASRVVRIEQAVSSSCIEISRTQASLLPNRSAKIQMFTVSRFAHAHLEWKQGDEMNDEDSFTRCFICHRGGGHTMVASCCPLLPRCQGDDCSERSGADAVPAHHQVI